jgi:hypothetical protein
MRGTPGLVGTAVAAVLLIGTTFADWYVVVIDNAMFGSMMRNGSGNVGRVTTTPWSSHAPLAGLLLALATASVALAALSTAKKAGRAAYAGGAVVAALATVSVIGAQLAQGRVQELAGFTVTIAYAPAFFVAAAASAALLLASGANLWQASQTAE